MNTQYSTAGDFEPAQSAGAFVWLMVLLTSVFVVLIAAAPPWLGVGPRAVLLHAFQTLCHQRPERSFQVGGVPFAVCHRCFGLYLGVAVGLSAGPIAAGFANALQKSAVWLVTGPVVLMTMDWGLDVAGILSNTASTRTLTGLGLGVAGGIYLATAVLSRSRREATKAPKSGG